MRTMLLIPYLVRKSLSSLTIPFLRFYVFVLAGFVGYQIITKVPALLHTPLMSATNAISGISLVGSLSPPARPAAAMHRWDSLP
jgi:NAD/NADP transhydrogenase alpha subunit